MELTVGIQVCFDHPDFAVPAYTTTGASGMDLQAAIPSILRLDPSTRMRISCGIKVAIPDGYEGQVRPRSGLSYTKGLTVINSPGTIDSDYRGEVCVTIINLSDKVQEISPLDRIAQLVICPVVRVTWQKADTLDTTVRGEKGYGSTGV